MESPLITKSAESHAHEKSSVFLSKGKLQKPNIVEYTEALQKKKTILSGLTKEMTELSKQITSCKSTQTDYFAKRDSLRVSLDSLTAQMNKLNAERSEILLNIEKRKKEGRETKSSIQNLRRNLGFQSEEEVDQKIKEIEKCLLSSKLSVQQENQMISKIQQLRQNKPLLANYVVMEAGVDVQEQESIEEQRQRLIALREEMKPLLAKKRDILEELNLLTKHHQEAIAPLNELFDRRSAIKKEIATHRQEELTLLQELEKKSKEYQLQAVLEQKKIQQKRTEEFQRKQLEATRESLEKQLQNVEQSEGLGPQYILTQQMVNYMRGWVKKADESRVEEQDAEFHECPSKTPQTGGAPQLDGLILMKPKHQRDQDLGASHCKKKLGKKSKKSSLKQPLVHDISVLSDFERLNIHPPLCLEDCYGCLQELEKKLKALEEENAKQQELTNEKRKKLLEQLENLTTSG